MLYCSAKHSALNYSEPVTTQPVYTPLPAKLMIWVATEALSGHKKALFGYEDEELFFLSSCRFCSLHHALFNVKGLVSEQWVISLKLFCTLFWVMICNKTNLVFPESTLIMKKKCNIVYANINKLTPIMWQVTLTLIIRQLSASVSVAPFNRLATRA